MQIKPVTILIAEDNSLIRRAYCDALQAEGYTVVATTKTGEEAIALADRHRPSHVVIDIRLKGALDGIAVAEAIQRIYPCGIIFATGFSDNNTLRRLTSVPSIGILIKPVKQGAFRSVIDGGTAVSRNGHIGFDR